MSFALNELCQLPPLYTTKYILKVNKILPVYHGVKHQYGYRLGSIFKTALKTVTPLIKPLVKSGLNAVKRRNQTRNTCSGRYLFTWQNPKQVAISRRK